MNDKFKENVIISFDIFFDFISSLLRIENNQELEEIEKEYGITLDNYIRNWVKNVYDSFDKKQKERLNFYFGGDNPSGLGLIDYAYQLLLRGNELIIETVIDNLQEIDPVEILYYLLYESYQANEELSTDLISKWNKSNNLYEIIDNNFELTIKGKWNIFKMLSKPEETKQGLIDLLRYYYNNFYKDEKDQAYKFLEKYCRENEELIIETADKFFDNFFASDKKKIISKKPIRIIPIYFGELMSVTDPESNYLVMGYKYYEFVNKAFNDINNIEEQAHIFKALGDKTRIKILQELLNGPQYMTELGEKLEVSTPTINYHIKKFLNAGLVQVDKAENRIYYKLRKDKLKSVIKLMEENYNL